MLAEAGLETPTSEAALLAHRVGAHATGLRSFEIEPRDLDQLPLERYFAGYLCGTWSIELQPHDPQRAALFQARSQRRRASRSCSHAPCACALFELGEAQRALQQARATGNLAALLMLSSVRTRAELAAHEAERARLRLESEHYSCRRGALGCCTPSTSVVSCAWAARPASTPALDRTPVLAERMEHSVLRRTARCSRARRARRCSEPASPRWARTATPTRSGTCGVLPRAGYALTPRAGRFFRAAGNGRSAHRTLQGDGGDQMSDAVPADTAPQPRAAARTWATLKLLTASVLFALAGAFVVQLGYWVLGASSRPAVLKHETPLASAAAFR